jgi:hypothetical protein
VMDNVDFHRLAHLETFLLGRRCVLNETHCANDVERESLLVSD